ncbi:MAG: NAD(P)/FAD-dependent oxidoreductase [Candidatus Poribacteria bacterium]|nr:NAD(P)/FAD-dependent oxidoreductase [Candidatus Poribacteria bacterium]
MSTHKNYDTIIIGGGPAGSTAATLIAQQGYRVLLLERDAEPTFKIGESLIPATYWTFKRLGMLEKLRASHFPQKFSVQFFTRTGKATNPFYFFDTNPHESAVTWQVLRSEFDQMLLDNAIERGVEVRRGVRVRKVLFEGDKAVGVVSQNGKNGQSQEKNNLETIQGTVIVDSTGQRSLIGRQLDLNTIEPNLKKASLFTHYEGGHRDTGIDEGATLILHTEDKDSWFWSIPLPYNRTSIGVVGELDYLLQNRRESDGKLNAQKIFDEELEKCQPLKQRLEGAKQLFPIQTTKDFSYRASRIAGDNWVLIGDAFGFLDPVYSTGLFLALKSGEMAADAIIEAFRENDFSETQLGSFGHTFVAGMEAFRKLVYAFYTKEFSFARFLSEYPEHLGGIVDILSGDVYRRDVTHIFPAMSKMCYFPPEVPLGSTV